MESTTTRIVSTQLPAPQTAGVPDGADSLAVMRRAAKTWARAQPYCEGHGCIADVVARDPEEFMLLVEWRAHRAAAARERVQGFIQRGTTPAGPTKEPPKYA